MIKTSLQRATFAIADLGDVAGDATASMRQFAKSRGWLPPAPVKPAFRGRRHGWRA